MGLPEARGLEEGAGGMRSPSWCWCLSAEKGPMGAGTQNVRALRRGQVRLILECGKLETRIRGCWDQLWLPGQR